MGVPGRFHRGGRISPSAREIAGKIRGAALFDRALDRFLRRRTVRVTFPGGSGAPGDDRESVHAIYADVRPQSQRAVLRIVTRPLTGVRGSVPGFRAVADLGLF